MSKQRKETKPDEQEDSEGEMWEGVDLLKNTLTRKKVSSWVICLIYPDHIVKHIKPKILFGNGLSHISSNSLHFIDENNTSNSSFFSELKALLDVSCKDQKLRLTGCLLQHHVTTLASVVIGSEKVCQSLSRKSFSPNCCFLICASLTFIQITSVSSKCK